MRTSSTLSGGRSPSDQAVSTSRRTPTPERPGDECRVTTTRAAAMPNRPSMRHRSRNACTAGPSSVAPRSTSVRKGFVTAWPWRRLRAVDEVGRSMDTNAGEVGVSASGGHHDVDDRRLGLTHHARGRRVRSIAP